MVFALSERGRRIPLDPEPNEAGNVYVEIVDGVIVGHVGRDLPGVCYMTHFATCPVLNKDRKPKKPKPEPSSTQGALDL